MVKNLDRSFFRFVTNHACDRRTDRQTDGRTEFSSLDRVCITCSAVKTLSYHSRHPFKLTGCSMLLTVIFKKMLSYRRETALQDAL